MSSRRIVLIGPAAAGKSALGVLVADRLGLPFVDLDAVGPAYYREVGWSLDRLRRRSAEAGRVPAEREWEPARAHAVVRVLEDHPTSVVALGAGHTSYIDEACLATVRRALAPERDVVLLLPSRTREDSLTVLRQRSMAGKRTDWVRDGHDFLAEWLDDAGMRSLATRTVWTTGETPAQTADRLVPTPG